MLQNIREKSKGWLAYVVVGLISIPFMFFGIQQYLGGGADRLVAEVNDVEITAAQFDRALRMQQQRMREMFGGNVPPGLLEGGMVNQSVLSGMVREELLRQYADTRGFRVSEPQVIEEIQRQEAFQENGVFSAEKFDRLLTAQRRNKAAYVQDVKLSMQIGQLQSVIDESAFMTGNDYSEYLKLKNQTRSVDFFQIKQANFQDQVEVSDEEIDGHYKENSYSFLSQEQVKLDYIVLDLKALESQVDVSDDVLQSLYEQEKDLFVSPASRKAQHILVEEAKGEAAALEIAKRINAGEDFSALAKELSTDKLSADNGGDLGFVFPGDMDPEFEKVLFTLDAGQLSAPVKTDQGFHLVKYTEENPSVQKSFEESKSDLEKEYRQREADRIVVDKTEQLLTLTYENFSTLEPAADALGIKIETTDWMARGGADGLWREPKLLTAAFSDDVLNQERNSDVLETGDGKQVVLRISEHKPAATKPLEEVKEQVVSILKKQKANKLAQQAGAQALAALDSNTAMSELATENESELSSFEALAREGEDVSGEITTQLFKLAAPAEGDTTTTGFELASGDYIVASLRGVAFPENASEEAAGNGKQNLVNAGVRTEIDAVLQAMESRADIKIYQENIQAQ